MCSSLTAKPHKDSAPHEFRTHDRGLPASALKHPTTLHLYLIWEINILYNTKEIFKSIREKYKELPFMIGQASDEANSLVSIWLNPVDNNWTILATKKDLTCVVGVGTDMKIIPHKKGTDI